MSQPWVSILVAAYNHASYIEQALHSALNQTYPNLEVIVIDDGSQDDTFALCQKVAAGDSRMHVESRANQGVVATLNQLIARGTGDYFSFLASDDVFHPQKTAVQVAALQSRPELAAVFSFAQFINAESTVIPEGPPFNTALSDDALVQRMLLGNVLCASCGTVRKSVVQAVGAFDSVLPYTQDYDYWLRIMRHARVQLLPEVLVSYRVHAQNLSGKDTTRSAHETWNVICRHADALVARYAPAVKMDEALHEAIASIAYQAQDWDVAAEIMQIKRSLYAHQALDALRLLDCYLKLGQLEKAQSLLRELQAERRIYGQETVRMIDQFSQRLGVTCQ